MAQHDLDPKSNKHHESVTYRLAGAIASTLVSTSEKVGTSAANAVVGSVRQVDDRAAGSEDDAYLPISNVMRQSVTATILAS